MVTKLSPHQIDRRGKGETRAEIGGRLIGASEIVIAAGVARTQAAAEWNAAG